MAGTRQDEVALVWDERVRGYDFGAGHPLAPVRVELTRELIRRSGLLRGAAREVVPEPFDPDDLLRVHAPAYVETVRLLSRQPTATVPAGSGLGYGDTPAFLGMHEAALAVVTSTVDAARRVLDGRAVHAMNVAGGLHHAMPDRAAGFCVYNDLALAIDGLLRAGAERVAYVDVDVHHGDGVEVAFRDDPRVLTISLHESGRYLFPGTGDVEDIGGPGALGSAMNVPLLPGTTGDVWLAAFDAVVEPVVRAFAPDVLVTQLGCDTHASDPLAHLMLTLDDMAAIHARLHALAHDAAGGRWVATGGGGYRLVDVVPRAWTSAFAELSGGRLPPETPLDWQDLVRERTHEEAPVDFTDAPVEVAEGIRGQAREAADDVVARLRRTVLARHGAG
jgi:acetoin utilization protein AcuC